MRSDPISSTVQPDTVSPTRSMSGGSVAGPGRAGSTTARLSAPALTIPVSTIAGNGAPPVSAAGADGWSGGRRSGLKSGLSAITAKRLSGGGGVAEGCVSIPSPKAGIPFGDATSAPGPRWRTSRSGRERCSASTPPPAMASENSSKTSARLRVVRRRINALPPRYSRQDRNGRARYPLPQRCRWKDRAVPGPRCAIESPGYPRTALSVRSPARAES